jgi:hypothetical protein
MISTCMHASSLNTEGERPASTAQLLLVAGVSHPSVDEDE